MAGNRQIVIQTLPTDRLGEEHFKLQTAPMPSVGDGQVLVRTRLLSLDAANRAWMQGATYRQAVKAGDIMHAYSLGEVVESKAPGRVVPPGGQRCSHLQPAPGPPHLPGVPRAR